MSSINKRTNKPKPNEGTTQSSKSSTKSNTQFIDEKEKVNKSVPHKNRSQRAGIIFPVSRVHRLLREGRFCPKIQSGAPVYLAAVLEYLVLEILELSLNICAQNKKYRITPQFINWSISNDLELNHLFKNVTIACGGTFPQNVNYPQRKATKKSEPKPTNSTHEIEDEINTSSQTF